MIKIALKNIKILGFLNKLPVLKYFFILRIDKNFDKKLIHTIRGRGYLLGIDSYV